MKSDQKPINWKINVVAIWVSQVLTMIGFASAMPFIPILIREKWGITDERQLGILMAAFYFFGMLSFCVSTPVWGMLGDRYGRKLMLLRACYVDAILFPCFIFASGPVTLIVIRFIASAFTGTVSAAQTLIVTTTPEKHHGFSLGLLSSAIWSGNLIGFAFGGILVHYFGFVVCFLTCGLLYFAGGLVAQFFIRENFEYKPADKKQNSPAPERPVFEVICLLFSLVVITAIARKFDEPYVALMVEKVNGPEKMALYTGWISAIAALGGIFSGVVIGGLCDRYSPSGIMFPAVLIASLGMFVQAMAVSLPIYSGARFVNYLAAGGLEPIFMSVLARISPESRRGTIFGLASSIRMGGILVSSLLSGIVIYFWGVRNVYTVAGGLFILILPLCFYTMRKVKRIPGSGK